MPPLHVLVIDDSLADLYLMTAAFEIYPNVILITSDQGQTALRWLETQAKGGQCPDLILLDLHMPGMDGSDCLRALTQDPLLRDIPILLYSLAEVDAHQYKTSFPQIYSCWQKPMNFEGIQRHADTLWAIWEQAGRFRVIERET